MVDRFTRGLAAGRFGGVSAAARACSIELERLHVRMLRRNPGRRAETRAVHPHGSVRRHITDRLDALGLSWQGQLLAQAEARILNRHCRRLTNGGYHDAREAAEGCVAELARVAPSVGRTRALTRWQVQRRIYSRARQLASSWPYRRWQPDEQRRVERYARMVVAGRYDGTRPAAVACLADLRQKLDGAAAPRSFRAVHTRLAEVARSLGVHHYPRWLPAEKRLFDRYLRALFEGRYRDVRTAACECTRALRQHRPGSIAWVRSEAAVYHAMNHTVARHAIPRHNGETTRTELRLYERYARAVASGRYASCRDAAGACRTEQRRAARRAGHSSPLRVSRPAARTSHGIAHHICAAVHRLGLRIPRQRWCDEEQRVFAGWLRWYERYRRVRRLKPLSQAGHGLHEDLAKLGYRRSVCACKERLVCTRRLRRGGQGHRRR